MAAQTVFSAGVYPADVSLSEEGPGLGGLPRNMLPAPQLVMLANVAAVTAAEAGGGDGSVADEKEMMELKTVGSNYSDSEDESVIRYGYDNQSHKEVCIVEYPESPHGQAVAIGDRRDEEQLHPSQPCPSSSAPEQGSKRRAEVPADGVKKKKPFRCKPCHFQAQNEREFVEHLSSHSVSKMMVVSQVEGRSKSRPREAETPLATAGAETGEVKGLIRCERCGYNTNRYDHYIAHLKHHSKEGDDHRVFKCTLCPYTTVSQYHWRKHLRNHFPSKLHTCSQCSYFSDRKSNYIQHIRTHTGVRPFRCLYCDYSSSQKTHLTRHMRTHSGERPFKCDSCSYLAANQHEVTRHARQVHNGPKPLSCPYCEYKTADRSNFKKHVELHLNPRQFLCPLCKYAASKKCNLQYHIKSRHSGCNVTLDVSKVKLRIKKSGADAGEESPDPKANKFNSSSTIEEHVDDGDDDSSPINLSIRKSSRPNVNQVETQKAKETEKKITTRQKKLSETPPGIVPVKNVQTEASARSVNKTKKRVKKTPANKIEEPTTKNQETEIESSDPQTIVEEQPKTRREKNDKNLCKARKSGSKRLGKNLEHLKEPPQKLDGADKNQKAKGDKEKCVKRKVAEALDLSQESSKTRRLKTLTEKPLSKAIEETKKIKESGPTTREAPPKPKKAKKAVKKALSLQLTVGPAENKALVGSAQFQRPTPTTHEQMSGNTPIQTSSSTEPPLEPVKTGPPNQMEASPSISEPRGPEPAPLAPTFLKPTSPPPPLVLLGSRSKPSDLEDDEGIHSSQEVGSDISDSASEGSDDSGLNGNAAASGKMSNDPETPTEEIPTPTELKNHTCIFCDRTFPLEAAYRRHLNRHLVNVYYMDAAKAQN
ncbi:RE1-silencing transcription factor [Xenentodon cancila]